MIEKKNDQDIIQELLREVKALREENKALKKQIAELIELKNTNSRNSSKSPSQDPYRKREGKGRSSGKKQGAQQGHKGHNRKIVAKKNISEFRDIHPSLCPQCGGKEFTHKPICTEERQVTELPEIKPQIIQFNIHTEHCSDCGNAVKANIPKEAKSAFGPRLKGFITLLAGDIGLTKRKVVSLAGSLNVKISLGKIC